MSHPDVSGLIEPFQRRRKETDVASDYSGFLQDNERDLGGLRKRPNLALKETSTRIENVEKSLKLLESIAGRGVYTGLILILRCPYAAFLSQVEASNHLWTEKKLTAATNETFQRWISGQIRSLRLLTDYARAQHFRLVSYEAFCANPKTELARLMALIPLHLSEDQLFFSAPDGVNGGGDPKTKDKAGKIEVTDRAALIQQFAAEVEQGPARAFADGLRDIVRRRMCKEPDRTTLDAISRLCMQRG